jgi:hypothetical protein
MKALPMKLEEGTYTPCTVEEVTHIQLDLPGPISYRMIPVITKGTRNGTGNWSWNGDTEKPTLKPSISTTNGHMKCHTFITDGNVRFLKDCTHSLAGKTLPLNEVEE